MKRILSVTFGLFLISSLAFCKNDNFREPDVVWVPTPQEVVNKMLEMARVQKGDVLYDLGCGDGRIVVTAAKQFGVKA
ncbi:MAG TPA: class I SAM-dependent methyltransferase, partial [Spirochaetota bacterium]|nr:class I SAM-dependent methyltransferase [Spirochaetota bacterium]